MQVRRERLRHKQQLARQIIVKRDAEIAERRQEAQRRIQRSRAMVRSVLLLQAAWRGLGGRRRVRRLLMQSVVDELVRGAWAEGARRSSAARVLQARARAWRRRDVISLSPTARIDAQLSAQLSELVLKLHQGSVRVPHAGWFNASGGVRCAVTRAAACACSSARTGGRHSAPRARAARAAARAGSGAVAPTAHVECASLGRRRGCGQRRRGAAAEAARPAAE
jgi:hypothetical protein